MKSLLWINFVLLRWLESDKEILKIYLVHVKGKVSSGLSDHCWPLKMNPATYLAELALGLDGRGASPHIVRRAADQNARFLHSADHRSRGNLLRSE